MKTSQEKLYAQLNGTDGLKAHQKDKPHVVKMARKAKQIKQVLLDDLLVLEDYIEKSNGLKGEINLSYYQEIIDHNLSYDEIIQIRNRMLSLIYNAQLQEEKKTFKEHIYQINTFFKSLIHKAHPNQNSGPICKYLYNKINKLNTFAS